MSFSEVRDGIWVGGMPGDVGELYAFPRIALVAPLGPHEQGMWTAFPMGSFLYMPLSDAMEAPSDAARKAALMAAAFVTESARQGHKTLALCREGRNRSGLVAALALTQLHGCSGATAMRIVQTARPHALHNFYFQELLRGIEARDDVIKETP